MSFSFTLKKMVSFLSNCVVNLIYIIIWYRLSVCMYVCMTMYVCMYGFEILKAVVINCVCKNFIEGYQNSCDRQFLDVSIVSARGGVP